jgi:hypothetical protein
MKTYTIQLEVEVRAPSREAAYTATDYALDVGKFQEEIEDRGLEVLAARVSGAYDTKENSERARAAEDRRKRKAAFLNLDEGE